MTDEGSASKLRLTAKANGRLLKGYGPLAALLVAFLLMAMLVPTKAPQQDVVQRVAGHRRAAGAGAANTSGAAGAAGGAGTAAGAAGAAGGAAAGATGGAASAKTAGSTAPAALGKSGGCPGQSEQVPGDPYSPAVHLVFRQ